MNSSEKTEQFDAVIVGGGFYGCSIALFLKSNFGLNNILVVEREHEILKRASLINQARVHSGYHYPRSFITAFRSRRNFAQFVSTFEDCIDDSFVKLYAIARRNSYVTASQFVRFCKEIEAPLTPARWQFERLFSKTLVDAVFEVEEFAFDAVKLRARLMQSLAEAKVTLALSSTVNSVSQQADTGSLKVEYQQGESVVHARAKLVFDCTYAGLNQLKSCQVPLKFEIAEMALVQVPDALSRLGITIMDGPFFSVMPFPSRQLHSLSHVRYTPRVSWTSDEVVDRQVELDRARATPCASYMIRDASKFLPSLSEAIVHDSMFEIKTLLVKNELDDGRPILFNRPDANVPYYCVLGGKIDNIFDIYEELLAKRQTLSADSLHAT